MNQKERFEAAFKAKWPYRHPNDATWAEYENFKLGEASGMERAAKACDGLAENGIVVDRGQDIGFERLPAEAGDCANEIRALMAQGEI